MVCRTDYGFQCSLPYVTCSCFQFTQGPRKVDNWDRAILCLLFSFEIDFFTMHEY